MLNVSHGRTALRAKQAAGTINTYPINDPTKHQNPSKVGASFMMS